MTTNLGVTRSRTWNAGISETLIQAWRAMVHPATWVCIFVLLLNDQLLRWRWPSWMTGKLGDVAWLAFAPLIVALGLALLGHVASRWGLRQNGRGQNAVILVSIALVGGVFAVIKTLPAATALFHTGFNAVFGWRPLLVRDPTDLLTLPALAIAWLIWRDSAWAARQHRPPAQKQGQRSFRLTGWSWAALGLALLATLGNSGPPDVGIVCVERVGDRLVAGPHYSYAYTRTYESTDGGLTWTETATGFPEGPEMACPVQEKPWTVALPGDGVLYEVLPGSRIQRSVDGGATWTTEVDLTGTEARMAYFQSMRSTVDSGPGPHNAVYDEASGNLLFAMGFEGILVRRDALTAGPPALWQWVPVGDYRFEQPTGVDAVTTLLGLEALLAVSVALMSVAFSGWHLFRWPFRSVVIVWALGIVGTLLILRPALMVSYATMVGFVACSGLAVGALIIAIVAGVWIWQHGVPRAWRGLLGATGVGILTAALFLTPLVLWAVGLLAYYALAMWIAALVAALLWAYAATRKRVFSLREEGRRRPKQE
jgi:hypothetical protein